MREYSIQGMKLMFDYMGNKDFNKYSMVTWLGLPVRFVYNNHTFNFDLEGRIHSINGDSQNSWPNSWDWLQRTPSNEWLYYSYPGTNSFETYKLTGDHFHAINTWSNPQNRHGFLTASYVKKAFKEFDVLIEKIRDSLKRDSPVHNWPKQYQFQSEEASERDSKRVKEFLKKAAEKDKTYLEKDGKRLHKILGGNMPILPPDTIHVDYRVIPVLIMDGCGYGCDFCMFHGKKPFRIRNEDNIQAQIQSLREFYGEDLRNFNSVVLGQNNGIAAEKDKINLAARLAYEQFGIENSYFYGSNLFIFSTNQTFLGSDDSLFSMLEVLPYSNIYINIGWEAIRDDCLESLGKPHRSHEVIEGMRRASEINKRNGRLRISGNFIIGENLPENHPYSIADAIQSTEFCGRIYLSPLQKHSNYYQIREDLKAVKSSASKDLSVLLYTMQRL